ncbi:DEAD/DEAH box helicase, partial [Planktothrix sp.]|uniref:DEAD/DEAH box helicase n=1 Tax=Planktothrix sp. TaxID=3088171 RepID=UPI0038D46919
MYDPVGAFEKIKENFLLYIKTAFATRFPEIEQERENKLREDGVFCQEPWIEPLPRYKRSGKTIHQLELTDVPRLNQTTLKEFQELAACGLVGDYELYGHQLEMLKKALSGQNAVVTAGTGSGKTESFLLPLFAYLIQESKQQNWQPPNPEHPHLNDWWSNSEWQDKCHPIVNTKRRWERSYRIPQRGHENREAAVRALILYPMNALVEDQLTRLRRALDSEEVRNWFQQNRNGNRIYFGRYNGVTPVPGHELNEKGKPNGNKIEELVKQIKQMANSAEKAKLHSEKIGNDEVQFFFPQLDGAEMRCRWDMQDHPPDILITNYSMLSIMLMRDVDKNIFEKTKKWLENKDSVFHLILDELHLYRGTQGTEVAYLLRLLLQRLGLYPGHPQLRILASSASLEPDDRDSLDFLSDFFGTEWHSDQIIPGDPEPIPDILIPKTLPNEPFIALADLVNNNRSEESLKQTSEYKACQEILESQSQEISAKMILACQEEENAKTRAVSLSHFAKQLFGETLGKDNLLKAIRGLLITRGLSTQRDLISFRFHWFFRNIEGLWACTQPNYGCEENDESENRPIGRLFVESPPILFGQYRVLELLYCEQCGTVFYGGNRLTLPDNEGWELLPTEPDIEGIPDRKTAVSLDRKNYFEYAVFWPFKDELDDEVKKGWNQPLISSKNTEKIDKKKDKSKEKACWDEAHFDTRSGRVSVGKPNSDLENQQAVKMGYVFNFPSSSEEKQQSIQALPSVCPCCSADYTRKKIRKSPIRGFRTGFSKVSQLLSKELFYQLPDNEESRKLVVFSDSREDAASIANGIERSHYDDLVRETIVDEL